MRLQNFRQPHRDRGKADDRKIAERKQARQPLRRHLRAADAGETHSGAATLPQRLHQRGAKPIAGVFAGDKKDVEAVRSLMARLPRRRRHKNIGAVGLRHHLFRLGNDGFAGNHGNAGEARLRDAGNRLRPDRGQIEAPVLRRLCRLDQHAGAAWRAQAAVRAHFGDARQHLVGAFR